MKGLSYILISMIKLFFSGLLFSITFITNAATVQPTMLTDGSAQFLDQKQQIINNITLAQREVNHSAEGALFLNSASNTFIRQENANQSNLSRLKSFAKKLNDEYADNELVQKSLSALYGAKQLWDTADTQTNAFAYKAIFSLKLNQFIEQDIASSQHSLQNSSTSNQYHKTNEVSLYQVQQTQANTSANNFNELSHQYLSSLLSINTVYYLIALYILFMILIWAIKFTLRFFP